MQVRSTGITFIPFFQLTCLFSSLPLKLREGVVTLLCVYWQQPNYLHSAHSSLCFQYHFLLRCGGLRERSRWRKPSILMRVVIEMYYE